MCGCHNQNLLQLKKLLIQTLQHYELERWNLIYGSRPKIVDLCHIFSQVWQLEMCLRCTSVSVCVCEHNNSKMVWARRMKWDIWLLWLKIRLNCWKETSVHLTFNKSTRHVVFWTFSRNVLGVIKRCSITDLNNELLDLNKILDQICQSHIHPWSE